MKKNLRSKILLCVLAGGVLAANTALAAEYTVPVEGANDSYGNNGIRTDDGDGNYTYSFSDGDVLNLENQKYAVKISQSNTTYEFSNSLDINMQNNNDKQANGITISGIVIDNGYSNTIIDRSEGGNITLTGKFNDGWGVLSGVTMQNTVGDGNNVIKIGDGNITVSNSYQTSSNGAYAYGINFDGYSTKHNDKIYMGNGTIDVSAYVKNGYIAEAAGIGFSGSSQGGYLKLGDDVKIKTRAGGDEGAYSISSSRGISLLNQQGFAKISGNNLTIDVAAQGGDNYADAIGIYAEPYEGKATVTLLGGGDIKVQANNLNSTAGGAYASGILIGEGVSITKESGKIETIAEGNGTVASRGVFLRGSAQAELGIVDISTETKGGSTSDGNYIDSIAIWARDYSVLNMDGGSVEAKADTNGAGIFAILTDSNAEVNINKETSNDVAINGYIETRNSSKVNLNLNTEASYLNGHVYDNSTLGTTLNLANSATWNNDGTSLLSTLTMDGGIINQKAAQDITINSYSGTGIINYLAEATAVDGVVSFANTGDVTIESAEAGSSVNLGVINNTVNTLDIDKTEENLNALAQKLTYKGSDSNLSGKVTVKEGLITPEASADLLFDGNNQGYVTNITGGNRTTQTMDAMKNLAATAIVAWRQEDSTLSQRLGELRESDGGQGIWVRMSRGEFEYDGEYKNQYNFFQMGYDWAAGSWHYGAAISHNDGQTTYTHGDGENHSTSLSLYGTWLGDKGHYADIVLKQGRLSNDFDIYTEAGHTSGDYDAWGTSLSGEYGMKVDLDGGWYVTPQAQLTLMRIGGEDYTTNNGIKVNQDSLESAVGRVGFEVGKHISDSGSIYAKASLLHDFAGSADTYLSLNGLTNSYHQDIGDTWCEAGIGFNYKTSENSYVYADVVKNFGGDVETPWQWNAGMRWTF